jgi:hypothetical protein
MNTSTIISIVLIIIILIALYQGYYYLNPQLLNEGEVISLKREPPKEPSGSITTYQLSIGETSLEDPESIRYFYDGWLRVNSVPNDNTTYVIFNRGNDFIVALKGHVLSLQHAKGDETNKVDNNGTLLGSSNATIAEIATNLPFQKWVYFCINVDENRMDFYLNGKLTKSVKGSDITNPRDTTKKLDFSKFSNTGALTVGNTSVVGRLARFRREPGNMDPQSVWNVYIQGPGINDANEDLTGDYHAKASILRKGKPVRSMQLF